MNGLLSTGRARRTAVTAVAIGAVLAVVVVGAPTVFGTVVSSMRDSARYGNSACGGAGLSVDRATTITGVSDDQVRNAGVIVQIGQGRAVAPRGWVIAVATAMQESGLRNLDVAVDHDSLGLFQQRPSTGWGTPAQILDPRYASAKFYEKLVRVPGWERMRLTDAAQAVQVSAYPDRYQRWEPFATLLVNRLTGGAANGVAGTAGDPVRCAGPGQVSAGGWTVPAPGSIVSGFRGPGRPSHNGVDIGSPRFTTIRAAAAGIVITVRCNVSVGTCDQDGSRSVKGCGWYVEVFHGGNVVTRYCHMVERPAVTVGQRVEAGQPLGRVGTSGNSSGPHLHFEVHTGLPPSSGNATDPIPFMAARGAPLGARQ